MEDTKIIHRKIQRTGGSTYIISLPKWWIEKHGLRDGDFLALNVEENLITIYIEGDKFDERAIIKANDIDPKLLERLIISHYLAGYDIIRIEAEPLNENLRTLIKRLMMKKMIGFEVIDEDVNSIEMRSLVRERELSLDIALTRMFKLGKILVSTLPETFISLNEANAKFIIQSDDDMDRLYLYTLRMIRKTKSGKVDTNWIIITSMMAKALERIVDHTARIAYTIMEMGDIKGLYLRERIYALLHITSEIFTSVYHAYIKKDLKLANEIISRVKEAAKKYDNISHDLRKVETLTMENIIHLNTILDSGKRICEYSADIGEMIIDLNTALTPL